MSGSPIKHERNRLVRAAIMLGLEDGGDPVKYVHDLVIQPVKDVLADGDATHSEKLAAANFLSDRIDGKPAQEIQTDPDRKRLVDEGLIGFAGDLLRLVAKAQAVEVVPVEKLIEPEPES